MGVIILKIGFYDSGIGGLSVLETALKQLPDEQFIYYADTDNVPYGEKSNEEILNYAENAVKFMIENGAKAVVIACNTATSVAAKFLREKYSVPIIGMEPAVKPAVEIKNHKKILVSATAVTIREKKLKDLISRIDKNHDTELVSLGGLVKFAEKGTFDSAEIEKYLTETLSSFELNKFSAIVLGCTHFNYFKDTLRKILPSEIVFVDGINGTVKQLKKVLEQNGLLENNKQTVEFYHSGKPANTKEDLQYFKNLISRLEEMKKIK